MGLKFITAATVVTAAAAALFLAPDGSETLGAGSLRPPQPVWPVPEPLFPQEVRPGLSINALAETVWIEEFDLSPDGRRLVFKSAAAGSYDLWTVPVAGGEPVRLTRMAGREMAPRFSPDGRWIAFEADFGGTDVRDIYLVSAEGGEPRLLTPNTFEWRDTEPRWSPDGARLAFISDRNGFNNLGVIDPVTGEATMLLVEEVEHSEPRWSPDGRWISFTKNLDYDYHIFRIPAEGGQAEQVTWATGVNGGSRATDHQPPASCPQGRRAFRRTGVLRIHQL